MKADCRNAGVSEIVFFDLKKKRARHLKKNNGEYDETIVTTGKLRFDCIPGFEVEMEWIFVGQKPEEFTILRDLIEAAERGDTLQTKRDK